MKLEIIRNSKLPIYKVYLGFGAIAWKGNAKNKKDAMERAYVATGLILAYAEEVKNE